MNEIAIEFAKWINNNWYYPTLPDMWVLKSSPTNLVENNLEISTKQLFDIFIIETRKK